MKIAWCVTTPSMERLATISVAHIYNLRRRPRYRQRRTLNYTRTRAVQVAIGERRKPQPEGRPGYLRVDMVHQGDLDGIKVCVSASTRSTKSRSGASGGSCFLAITQTHLEPVLRAILQQFPFLVRGFHSDDGSEFINDTVSGLLRAGFADRADQIASAPQQRQWLGGIENGGGDSQATKATATSRRNTRQTSMRFTGTPLQSLSELSTVRADSRNGSWMSAAKKSMCTGVTPRRGKRCANCHALGRKPAAISNRNSASRALTGLRLRTATPSRPGQCKKPNESSFSPSGRSVEVHNTGRAPWKSRAVENEETKIRFPFVSRP